MARISGIRVVTVAILAVAGALGTVAVANAHDYGGRDGDHHYTDVPGYRYRDYGAGHSGRNDHTHAVQHGKSEWYDYDERTPQGRPLLANPELSTDRVR